MYCREIEKQKQKGAKYRVYHRLLSRYVIDVMKKYRNILCFAIALILAAGCCGSALADNSPSEVDETVEEAVDEVALAEAEAEAKAKAEEEAKAEAEKVNEVLDLNENDEESAEKENKPSDSEMNTPVPRQGISGSTLALIVGLVLIVLGGIVIIVSSRKIRKGKAK